jgi:hypothetical protein
MLTKFIADDISHKTSLELVFVNELQFLVERICAVYNDYVSLICKKTSKDEQNSMKKRTVLSNNSSKIPNSSLSDIKTLESINTSPISISMSSIKNNQNGSDAFNSYYKTEKKRNIKKEIFKKSGILKENEFCQENQRIKEIKSSILHLQSYCTINNEKSILGKSISDSYKDEILISHVDLSHKLEDPYNTLGKDKLEVLKSFKNVSFSTISKLFRVKEEKEWLNNNNNNQPKEKAIRESEIILNLPLISPKISSRQKNKTMLIRKKFLSQK